MAVRPLINPPYRGRHRVAMPMGFAGLGSLPFPSSYASWLFYASGRYRDLGQAGQSQTLMQTLWPSLDANLQSEFAQYIGPNFHPLTGTDAPKGFQARAFLVFLDPVTDQPYTPVFKLGKLTGSVPRLGVTFEIKEPGGALATTLPFTSPVNLVGLLKDMAFKNKKTGFAVVSDTFLKMVKDPAFWKILTVAVAAPLAVGAAVGAAGAGAAGSALPAAFTATPEALTASYYGGATLAPVVGAPIVTGLTAAAPGYATASSIVPGAAAKVAPSVLKTAVTVAKAAPAILSTAATVAPQIMAAQGGGPAAAPAPEPTPAPAETAAPSALPSWGVPAMLVAGALLLAYVNS